MTSQRFSPSRTSLRRGSARVALAGALALVPLGALAATASAEAPADDAVVVQEAAPQAADISRPFDRDRPGPGPDRIIFRDERDPRGDGPVVLERRLLPPTGSAG
ncbi:hypothetical protein [Nocardia farcinica]|uniref:hypothetical protein n=1 Tax=Nocardia farcinica TaxID=37329 RepID=UPI001893A2A7|nr:hypothetical protein [Nocardia farcinica]MBF6523287.1 hypothetical protein [Nocardia farcinica]